MPDARRHTAEDLLVEALTDRLETALDLCASAGVTANLVEIARLCEDARVLAGAARLLTADPA